MSEQRVTISIEVLNKAMGILGQLPYNQVGQVIADIQKDVKPELSVVEGSEDEQDTA